MSGEIFTIEVEGGADMDGCSFWQMNDKPSIKFEWAFMDATRCHAILRELAKRETSDGPYDDQICKHKDGEITWLAVAGHYSETTLVRKLHQLRCKKLQQSPTTDAEKLAKLKALFEELMGAL